MLRIPISTHERILTPFKTSDGSELRTAADEVELALGGRLPPPVIRALVVPDGCGADSTEKVGMSEDVNIVIDDGETEREERVVSDWFSKVDEEGLLVPEEPPAASDSWANPTEGGLERKTEYTFFCNHR